MMRCRTFLLGMAFAMILPFQPAAHAQSVQWVGAWGAAPSNNTSTTLYQGYTIRQTVHLGATGLQFRLRLSNDVSTQPITLGAVGVALPGTAPGSINPAVMSAVLFGGLTSVTIPANGSVLSDPVSFSVKAMEDMTVSFYIATAPAAPTVHGFGMATGYTALGNQVTAATLSSPAATTMRFILSGVDVSQQSPGWTIVTIGDSITDGYRSTADTNHRWPDYLLRRLQAVNAFTKLGVVNAGITGNRLLRDAPNPSGLSRLSRDALTVPRARYICVLLGINDIVGSAGQTDPAKTVTAEDLIQGYLQIINRAHELGMRVFLGTITPFYGFSIYSASLEAIREQANTWIRGKNADGVLDFDAALHDPSFPARLLASYDSGDHVHPNDAGYNAMAQSVDLNLFTQ